MAKQSGLGSALFIGAYDLSGDVGDVSTIETSRSVLDVTAIDKSAAERIVGLKDGSLGFNSYWNVTAGQAHAVLSALPRTDVIASVFIGSTIGGAAASVVGKQVTYAPTRGADASLVASTSVLPNGYGLEWGEMLTTGKQTIASAANGTSIDLGSTSTLFGAAGYLHVFSVGSGTPTVTIEDSANDSSFTAVTGMAFTASPAATSERVQGAVNATVRRYVRIAVSGTFTDLVCAVNFVRYTANPST